MSSSSITKEIEIKDPKRFVEAAEEAERKYLDDLNDIFNWIPRGEYRRVQE